MPRPKFLQQRFREDSARAGVDLRDGEYDICSYSQTIDRYWGRDERAFDFALRAFDVPSFSAYAAVRRL